MKDRTALLAAPAALLMSFEPVKGDWLANYVQFFTSDRLWPTIGTTLKLALPATLINVGVALPIAYRMRAGSPHRKWLTTVLVVLITLVISGFPFAFLLILSYVTGIDPVLARAAATLGAGPWSQFRHIYFPLLLPGLAMCFCLAFVQAFSVFPSAVLVGAPAGPTRVISIAAYEAAFELYDYSLASAVAMIMGAVQLAIVALVLGSRSLLYRGPVTGGKG